MKFPDNSSAREGQPAWQTALFGAGIMILLSLGCASEALVDEPLGTSRELSAAGDFATFTPWTMPVNVCFLSVPSNDPLVTGLTLMPAEYSLMKDEAIAGLSQTWARVPGVSFVSAGECTSAMPNHLHLKMMRGGGGGCGGGLGTSCDIRANPSTPGWQPGFKFVLVHEVGHALGLAHEHKRSDIPVSCEANRVAACVRCKGAVDIGLPCAAADYNVCFSGNTAVVPTPPVSTPQSFGSASANYHELELVFVNNAVDPSMELLTTYDPYSIMNYCAGANGRDPNDFMPTALDLLGLEMTYPLTTGHRIGCLKNCIHTPAGVITRTDALIQTDWAERGALNSGIIVSGTPVPSITTSTLPLGESTLSYTFVAPRTGASLTASGTLVNSNAVYTAIVMAADPV